MFGTLQPPRCGPLPVVRTYRRFYCGTCQGLGAHFGQARRALLSHDAVFMAILADAVQVEAAAPSRCRCPLLPIAFRLTLEPSSVAMRYAAALQMLLTDQWLADRGADGRWAARLARPLISQGPARQAAALLDTLGVQLPMVRGFEGRQLAVERTAPGPQVAASPTAAVLAMAFETVADLPGAAPVFQTAEARAGLAELGAAVGTAIYLLDALEDLGTDERSGAFNPCAGGREAEAITALREALSRADEACAALPWVRHARVLRAVLRRFATRCHAACEPSSTRPSLVASAVGWGAMLVPDVPSDVPPDLGTPDVGTPDVGATPPPADDVFDGPAHGGCSACNDCGRSCDGCEGCAQGCGNACGDCLGTCDACVRCPEACIGGSGDCCNACGQGCGDCGSCCQGGGSSGPCC